jgi:predicted phosphodiesterase
LSARKPAKQEPIDERQALLDALMGSRAGAGRQPTPEEMIENLQESGYQIIKRDLLRQKNYDIPGMTTRRYDGGLTLRLGVVSDTHLGSQKQQLTYLRMFYRRAADRGVKIILHGGDLCDGDGRVYPGQQYDLFVHGYRKQLDYIAEHYPRQEGVTTYVIAGNHDWSFYQRGGADILAALAERRSDIRYLGPMSARLNFDGITVQLIHLKSGLTYARSYRLQKVIEQMAPEQKTNMLFAGDRHSWAHIPQYRNVYGWQLGCFQAQTEYEKRLGLFPEIGGIIVEVDYGTEGADDDNRKGKGIVAYRHEQLPFYVPIENDY